HAPRPAASHRRAGAAGREPAQLRERAARLRSRAAAPGPAHRRDFARTRACPGPGL
ncbi:MAG: L-carnitine dehydratase/bile acid-inducible protein F, partial [uncultured Microvirga sp.]